MPIKCSICCHSQAETIRDRLLAGENLAALARDYGLRVRDLRHHRDAHVLGKPLAVTRQTRRSPALME
jgi:hypothetical protein